MAGSDFNKEAKLPTTKMIPCPDCAASLRLSAYAQTLYLGCSGCDSIIKDPLLQPKVVSKLKNTEKQRPVIPIGTKGKLRGIIYEVVGFATYREYKTIYIWNEYILFNPVYGYATLSEFSGHWNYVVPTLNFPRERTPTLREFDFEDQEYRIFQRYNAKVDYAVGEFHWDLLDKELPLISEFISPPNIMIKEGYASEVLWYKGGYIGKSEIREAFGVKGSFPEKYGVGATQVSSLSVDLPIAKTVSLVFVLLLFLIQMIFAMFSKQEMVLNEEFSFTDTPVVTSSFLLSGSLFNSANLEFNLASPVDNNWMEVGITLVNDDTGEEYNFEQGVEYYHGYTGGENWSEGSQHDSKILSSIPDGRYHLNIVPYRGDGYGYGGLVVNNYSIDVKRDVPIWSNLLWLISAVAVIYFSQYFYVSSVESRRWSNSEFSL